MAGRADRGDRYGRHDRSDRSRSRRDRRDVGRGRGGHGNGNHGGFGGQGFRERRDRDRQDRQDRDVRDVNEELPALRRHDLARHRESARGRHAPEVASRGYDDEYRQDPRYGYGKGGHHDDRQMDRHNNYVDDRYEHRYSDRYTEPPDWDRYQDRDRFQRERYSRDRQPDHRDQRFERERFDRRPPERDQGLRERHERNLQGFRDERSHASQGGHRRQDDDMHRRRGEERHVDHRDEYYGTYDDKVENHSRSRRVRKVLVKERKPDVRHLRERGETAKTTSSGRFREDGREGRAELRGSYVQLDGERPRRAAQNVRAGERRPKQGHRPRHERSGRDRKVEERPQPHVEEEPPSLERRVEAGAPREALAVREAPAEAHAKSAPKPALPEKPPDKQERPEPGGPEESEPAQASGPASSPEEGETGSSESSSEEDCNSQADFSGSEESFHVAVAEEGAEGEPKRADAKDGDDSVMQAAEGQNGVSQCAASRCIPVPKHLCKQVAGLGASLQAKLDIQDQMDPCRVTVSGSEEEVEAALAKLRALGDRSHDAVELCVAKNAQGLPLQGWTEEKISQATKATVTFADAEDHLRVALKGPAAAVDEAWLLVVKAALGKAFQQRAPNHGS